MAAKTFWRLASSDHADFQFPPLFTKIEAHVLNVTTVTDGC